MGRESGTSTERVRQAAHSLGLDIEIVEMPRSTRTAEEAAAACGTDVARIVKSLVFRGRDDGAPVLLLVSGRNRVDPAHVARQLGIVLERPDADYVRERTGFAIGGVAPFGAREPLATYIDADLMAFDRVWAAAGAPHAVFEVSPRALVGALGAAIISVADRPAPPG